MLKLLTVREVADLLRVTDRRVRDLAREGRLPIVRLGRSLRVSEAALTAFVERGGAPLAGGWRRRAPAVPPDEVSF